MAYKDQIMHKLIGASGARRTQSLFIGRPGQHINEEALADAVYSILRIDDHRGKLPLYPEYVRICADDPTEQTFVNEFFVDWKQWEQICNTQWFKPIIAEWRKEVEVIVKARLVKSLLADAEDSESRTKTTSAKYLLERYGDIAGGSSQSNRRGRPSKEDVAAEVRKLASEEANLDEHLKRVN